MGILSKGEFADKCGMPSRMLSVYIKRGKVVVNSDGTIDDTGLQNVDFFKKHSGKPKPEKAEKKVVAKPKVEPKSNPTDPNSLYEIEKKRKDLDRQKTQLEIEILNERRDKMRGKVMPMDVLKPVLAQHFKDISIALNQELDGFITEISKKARLNLNESAELRGKIAEMINNAVHRSVESTNKSIIHIAREYSIHNSSGNKL